MFYEEQLKYIYSRKLYIQKTVTIWKTNYNEFLKALNYT